MNNLSLILISAFVFLSDMRDVMTGVQSEETEHNDVFDSSDVLNSTEVEVEVEVEGDDLGLSGYVQDNFEFLDQMDFSVMDHMDCGAPYQVCMCVCVCVQMRLQ